MTWIREPEKEKKFIKRYWTNKNHSHIYVTIEKYENQAHNRSPGNIPRFSITLNMGYREHDISVMDIKQNIRDRAHAIKTAEKWIKNNPLITPPSEHL